MNSTLKKVIPLVLVLLGLGGLATWDEWKTKKEEKEKADGNQLLKFDVAAVQSFEYFTDGKVAESGEKKEGAKPSEAFTAVIAKQDGKWRITSPVNASADATTVENLLKAVTDFKYEKVVGETKADWEKFGLNKPHRTIKVNVNGQEPVTLVVGMNAPVGYSAYVASSKGEKAYAGGQHISASLTKTLLELRDKSFVDINANDLTRFAYQKEKAPALEFAKVDGKFQIEKPEVFDTDSSVVTSFIEDVKNLKAADFIDKPEKRLQDRFSDKFLHVVISWTSAKEVKKLLFTYDSNELYASFDPKVQIFKLSPDAKGKITKSINDFRNKKIFSFSSAKVESLEADGKSYKKVKDNWYAADDAAKFNDEGEFTGKKDDEPKQKINARTLLIDLEYAKGEDFLKLNDPVSTSLNAAPKHKIVLTFTSDAAVTPLTIEAWTDSKNPEKLLVKHSSGKYIYRVAKSIFASASEEKQATTPNAKSDKALQDILNSHDPG